MAQNDTDLQKIKELIEIMKRNGLAEIEIAHGDDKILLKRFQPASVPAAPSAGTPAVGEAAPGTPAAPDTAQVPATKAPTPAPPQEELVEIKSPIVGTFYAAPSPDSEPYIELGSTIKPQTVVCIIEAMKVMNEIKAEASGTIAEILVTNGQAVEFGQVLFKLKPD